MYLTEYFHTVLYAQILGLYLIIMAIVMLSRIRFYRELIHSMQTYSPGMVIGASAALLFGLLLITTHNIWVMEPLVVVTLIAWFITIKAVLWLAIPEKMLIYTKKLYAGVGYYIVVIVMAILGIILLTHGFHHYT